MYSYDHGRRAVRRLINTGDPKALDHGYTKLWRRESFRRGAQRELDHSQEDLTRRQKIMLVNVGVFPS